MTHEEFFAAIDAMTVIELNDLVKAFEEKYGVSAAAPVAVAAAPGAAAAAPAEEQTEFDVILVDAGSEKIKVIKAVREFVAGLGLKARTSWKPSRRPSRKACPRKKPKRSRLPSPKLAPRSKSSNFFPKLQAPAAPWTAGFLCVFSPCQMKKAMV